MIKFTPILQFTDKQRVLFMSSILIIKFLIFYV